MLSGRIKNVGCYISNLVWYDAELNGKNLIKIKIVVFLVMRIKLMMLNKLAASVQCQNSRRRGCIGFEPRFGGPQSVDVTATPRQLCN